jgi:hypothetical protein
VRDLLHTGILLTSVGSRLQESGNLAFSEHVQHFVEPFPWTCYFTSWFDDEFHHQNRSCQPCCTPNGDYADGILSGSSRYISARISFTSNVFPTFTAPSEIISAFCLISGGLIFMASVSQYVQAVGMVTDLASRVRIQSRQLKRMD